MKAIRLHQFGDPSVLKFEETPSPVPGPQDVLVLMKATGVNPVDTYIRAGKYGPRPFPLTLGIDGAGVVEAVGSQVSHVKVGDRVYVDGSVSGTYAEKALCQANQVQRLPDALTFAQGAALGVPYVTAYFALAIRGAMKAGETVLIHGASGGVGTAAIPMAKAAGLRVIATAGTAKGRDHVLAMGADVAIDHTATGYMDHIVQLTNGAGVNLILEMLANVNLAQDLKILAKFGRVVVIGNRGTVEIDPRDLMSRNASVLGMSIFNASLLERAQCHEAIAKGIAQGTLKPVIGREMPLAEAAKAHEQVMAPGAYGKIVLIP